MSESDDNSDLELEYRSFSLSLTTPLETGNGTIDTRDGFLVRITDGTVDEGDESVGYGEAAPLSGWTESLSDCEAALERASDAIRNGPAAAIEAVEGQVAARHAVTLALADLQASRQATPLYRYIGKGPMLGRVPVNATVGDGSPDETAREAIDAVERGFDCCKIKVGRRSVEADIERLRQVRDHVGPDVELRVDANEAWSYEEARTALDALADLEVAVLEQPLPAGALEGHADLRAYAAKNVEERNETDGTAVSIALDEGLLEHGIDAICEANAADAVVLKPMALGGVDVARKIAAWVQELELTPIVTTTIDGVVARTGAVHLAASIPDVPACGLATAELLAEDLGRDPVLLEKGSAVVPQAKGLGLEGVWAE